MCPMLFGPEDDSRAPRISRFAQWRAGSLAPAPLFLDFTRRRSLRPSVQAAWRRGTGRIRVGTAALATHAARAAGRGCVSWAEAERRSGAMMMMVFGGGMSRPRLDDRRWKDEIKHPPSRFRETWDMDRLRSRSPIWACPMTHSLGAEGWAHERGHGGAGDCDPVGTKKELGPSRDGGSRRWLSVMSSDRSAATGPFSTGKPVHRAVLRSTMRDRAPRPATG